MITVLAYTGSFTFFSYISPLLIEVTGMDAPLVAAMMLVYGVAAAIGNAAGGRMPARLPDKAVLHLASVFIGAANIALSLRFCCFSR